MNANKCDDLTGARLIYLIASPTFPHSNGEFINVKLFVWLTSVNVFILFKYLCKEGTKKAVFLH